MRLVSTVWASDDKAFTSKLTPPPGDDEAFYTAGRMLSYGVPTKNGIVFFRQDCQPVVQSLQNSLSTIEHISPKNIGVTAKFGQNLSNTTMGSIFKYLEDEDGIDIICKNDKALVNAMGFSENDFNPEVGRFAAYSQESSYQPVNSPYITVEPTKAKSGRFDVGDIQKTYAFSEGQNLGLQPSRYNPQLHRWDYKHDPDGNVVFVRVRPTSFTGVGHVMMPADTTAEIYRYTANVEGEEDLANMYTSPGALTLEDAGRVSLSEVPGMDAIEPGSPAASDYENNPDLGRPTMELSSVDAQDDYDEGDDRGFPAAPNYDPNEDDIYLTNEDMLDLKKTSKSMSSYIDALIGETQQILSAALKAPYGKNAKYADPGYRGDKKRYPLDTPEHVHAAASYWGQKKNKSKYSPKERAQISAKIAAAEQKRKIGSYANSSYSAVWTSQHPTKPDKFVVNRRFRMTGDDGNLDRTKLVSAYHALSGVRGHTALTNDMPGPVRDHALALVRQGLSKTKNQIQEKSMSSNASDLTPELAAEIADLKQKAVELSAAKDTSAGELDSVRQEFSSYKETQEALVAELKQAVADRDAEIASFKSKELSSARLAQLEAVHPLTDDEKTEPKLAELMQTLSSVSDDRMETILLRRELEKTKAERAQALSSFGSVTLSPAPKFEGESTVENKTIDPTDFI